MRHLQLSLVVIFLFTFFVHVETKEAASGQTYEVGAGILHVREEPADNATIIGLLHKGDQLTVFQEKYGWVQTYFAGEEAWVAKHYLIPVGSMAVHSNEAGTETASSNVTVTAPSVHIRSGPGQDYASLAGTWEGETFQTLEVSGDWVKVSLANGQAGWIASWLTDSGSASSAESTVTQVASVNTEQERATGSLSGKTIVLDAGHGGRDPGAIGLDGIYEKDLVFSTTSKIADTLRTYGATVIETRTSDYFLTLDERASLSNNAQADAFISVHYNSFPVVSVEGINTFYYSNTSYQLAANVHASLMSHVPLKDRGMVQANYKVLRNTQAPAILLELGFITSPFDLSVVQTADYQYKAAEAITQGLLHYFY